MGAAEADMDLEAVVAPAYRHGALEQTIIAGLRGAGKDPDRLTPADLAPVDEFHVGGRNATIEFASRLGVWPGMKMLEIGSGLGGASRYFAAEHDCDVTGIDITDEYVAVASSLARRLKLADKVRYQRASAPKLPFADGAFDAVYMIHVGMNVADKAGLFHECRRVLAPDGVIGVYDVMREGPGELAFPMPWANEASASFVETAQDYQTKLDQAGFEPGLSRSRREFGLAFFDRMRAASAQNGGKPPPLGLHLIMGSSTRDKVANLVDAMQRGLVAPTEMFARRH